MVNKNEDNLKELFEKFFDAQKAARAVEDIRKADQILRENPAPEPDDMLIANIKAEISLNLLPQRAKIFRQIAYRAAVIAAAIIIIAAIGLKIFTKDNAPNTPPIKIQVASIIPRAIWESNDIASDDTKLAIYTTEAEQIKDEFSTLQSGRSEAKINDTVTELEMELMEIKGDFWKG
jgi:hypothetical protein